MYSLYNFILQAIEKDIDASMHLIKQFEPKVNQSLRKTPYQERDDLRQELQLKLLEAIYQFKIQDVPGFFDYVKQRIDLQ
ncbi:helix-turn-helix domain-containing protein [Bacillus horti]|uniref:Helix-turn-helix conjugative transposon-like domain-containing protein n=1 Tax=Caldalkalibacillus horti TaxID=77523 RepID=A0ABT9VXD2_9BACI|nr:helix-turn-helix domain-containing protein [Bacillus horti]MDQ0165653.1 hypothetical protein [Bacillus horti]